jgi:hypothetical protein
MNLEAMENILNDMLIALDEFKSEDIKYYEKQVSRVMKFARELTNEKED